MAWNLYPRMNKTFARNCTRLLQCNGQKLTGLTSALEEVQKPLSETQKPKKFNKFAISSQYRTTLPGNPSSWANSFEAEREILERNLQNQYLQPATMPCYRDQPIFDNQFMASLQEGQIMKAQKIATNSSARFHWEEAMEEIQQTLNYYNRNRTRQKHQKILESIKQKQAKNIPARLPRLTSNPFPDPIKATFSPYTLSDQEKADQMFLDQRSNHMKFSAGTIKSSKKFYSTLPQLGETTEGLKSLNSSGLLSTSLVDQVRFFSKKKKNNNNTQVCTDQKKTGKPEKPKRCVKMTIKGCPPARPNTICKQKNKEVKCTKIEAPYPSFSERCYIEPKGRTKECEICPWTEKNNPHFKGKLKIPPKFYHTECFPSSVQTSMIPDTTKFGYCDRHLTPLTEYFLKNENLLRNFRNGDDLSDFGIEKSTLSKLLSSTNGFEIFCKKGERINPDYPKNCEKPYEDETKNCPTGLTKRKSKKDRLKRKDPKNKK